MEISLANDSTRAGNLPAYLHSDNQKNVMSTRKLVLKTITTEVKPADSIFQIGMKLKGKSLLKDFFSQSQNVKATQEQLLLEILREQSETEFGKKHQFSEIKSVEDFRKNVPVHSYENLRPYIEKHMEGNADVLVKGKPILYATTSGTMGKPKYIPITEDALKKSQQNVSRLFSYSIFLENPEIYSEKVLAIVSPAQEGQTPDGTPYGSASGQLVKGLNTVLRKKFVLPYEVSLIADYDARYYVILLLGIGSKVSFLSTANPSTLSLLANKGNELKEELLSDLATGKLNKTLKIEPEIRSIIEKRLKAKPRLAAKFRKMIANDSEGKFRPKHYWSHLKLISCWTGGNCDTYLRSMKEWYGNVPLRDLGYLASEIRGTIPLYTGKAAGALTIGENFFEFVKVAEIECENPKYYLVHELEVGEKYYIFFTTRSGLYRYDINDIVEVKGFFNQIPEIVFVQKGRGVTNITGEKLSEEQVIMAMKETERLLGMTTEFFQMQAKPKDSHYELYVEFSEFNQSREKIKKFIETLENELGTINFEYKTKRISQRLKPIVIKELAPNSYEGFKRWRISQGVREAQFKTIPLSADARLTTPFLINQTVALNEK